jgi:hypothetical protein
MTHHLATIRILNISLRERLKEEAGRKRQTETEKLIFVVRVRDAKPWVG